MGLLWWNDFFNILQLDASKSGRKQGTPPQQVEVQLNVVKNIYNL